MKSANRPQTGHQQDIDRTLEWVINAPIPYDDHDVTEDAGYHLPMMEDDSLLEVILDMIIPSKTTVIIVLGGVIQVTVLLGKSGGKILLGIAGVCLFLGCGFLQLVIQMFTPSIKPVDRYRKPKRSKQTTNQQYIFNNCEHVEIHNHYH